MDEGSFFCKNRPLAPSSYDIFFQIKFVKNADTLLSDNIYFFSEMQDTVVSINLYLVFRFIIGGLQISLKYVKSFKKAIDLVDLGAKFVSHATEGLGSLVTRFALVQVGQVVQHVIRH